LWTQDHGDRRQLTAAIAIMDLHQERYLQRKPVTVGPLFVVAIVR
jgi:hypothetical protein